MSARRLPSRALLSIIAVLVCLLPCAARAESERHVDVVTVDGAIDPWVAGYIERGLATAQRDGAEALLIILNTPGGTQSAMQRATTALLNAAVPVVVYVSPSGAWAASAGTFVGLAAHILAMAPGTTIGAAHPVDASGADIGADERLKATNAAASLLASIAQQRGRNAEWAARAVRESLAATAQEAVALQISDLVAGDIDDLLRLLDGREVHTPSGPVTLRTAQARVDGLDLTWTERFFHTLVDPNIALVLLQLGLLALVVELYNPGISFAGIVGSICLVLALVALGNLPTNWAGAGLIIASVVLFIVDIKVNSAVVTVGGVATFVFGALLLFSPATPSPLWPRAVVSTAVIGALAVLALLLFTVVLAAAVRGRRAPALMGTAALAGATGVAVTDLTPRGQVRVRSEVWSATSQEGVIRQGEQVQVVGMRELTLHVVRWPR